MASSDCVEGNDRGAGEEGREKTKNNEENILERMLEWDAGKDEGGGGARERNR